MVVTNATASDSAALAVRMAGDSVGHDWVLVAARTQEGAMISLAGSIGGRAPARCGARVVEELLLDVPLSEHMVGAGLFDLSGSLVGMVVRCVGRAAAITSRQIIALLPRDSSITPRTEIGFTVDSLDAATREYFGTKAGLLVSSVRLRSAAHAAGLRPGDVILAVNGQPLSDPADLRARVATPDPEHVLALLRRGARSTIRLAGTASVGASGDGDANGSLGLSLAPRPEDSGVLVARVAPHSIAQLAGIRPGDRITQIGSSKISTLSAADRLLGSASERPTFITFVRDSVEHGALVRP